MNAYCCDMHAHGDTPAKRVERARDGMQLACSHVSYAVTDSDALPKHLLRDVSAIFNAGELTAIMGASGAGKSTLLRALAARWHGGVAGGRARVGARDAWSTTDVRAQRRVLMYAMCARTPLRQASRRSCCASTKVRSGESSGTGAAGSAALDAERCSASASAAPPPAAGPPAAGGAPPGEVSRLDEASR